MRSAVMRTKTINGVEVVVDCHTKYHVEKQFFAAASTVCRAVSDLTEED
jgi:hypothetical protein